MTSWFSKHRPSLKFHGTMHSPRVVALISLLFRNTKHSNHTLTPFKISPHDLHEPYFPLSHTENTASKPLSVGMGRDKVTLRYEVGAPRNPFAHAQPQGILNRIDLIGLFSY